MKISNDWNITLRCGNLSGKYHRKIMYMQTFYIIAGYEIFDLSNEFVISEC